LEPTVDDGLNGDERNTKTILIVATAISLIIVATSVSVILYTQNLPEPLPVKAVNPQYLGGTRIFLISGETSYGYYPTETNQVTLHETVVQKGDPCFFINIKIRNDYTSASPVDNYSNSSGKVIVHLTALLYDPNGTAINSLDVTLPNHNPIWGYNVPAIGLDSGETSEYQIILKTASRNIDHYNIVLYYVGSIPVP